MLLGCLKERGPSYYNISNRLVWMHIIGGLLLASFIPNPGLALLAGVLSLSLLWVKDPIYSLSYILWPGYVWWAWYALLGLQMRPWMVPWIEGAIIVAGAWVSLWAVWSWQYNGRNCQANWGLFWPFTFFFYESKTLPWTMGQGNPNHAQCFAVCTSAVGLGLVGQGQWWAIPVTLWLLIPVGIIQWWHIGKNRQLTQGAVHLANVLMAWLLWEWPLWGSAALVGYLLTALWLVKPWTVGAYHSTAGGRLSVWYGTVRDCWWKQTRLVKWFGAGPGTWIPAYTYHQAKEAKEQTLPQPEKPLLMTAAHNEYLQTLIEQGAMGLLGLLLGIACGFWTLWGAGPAALPVYLLAVALCSMAVTNFPWTLYHEVEMYGEKRGHGAPALNVLSLLTLLLIESIR